MKGKIRCNSCGKEMSAQTGKCPACDHIHCHIAVWWKGQTWRKYKDSNGVTLSVRAAQLELVIINSEIKNKIFRPDLWNARKDGLLDFAAERWLAEIDKGVRKEEVAYSTYIFYRGCIRVHIQSDTYGINTVLKKENGPGEWGVDKIRSTTLCAFAAGLPEGLARETKRAIMRVLHVFFLWLERNGLVDRIPTFPTVKGPKPAEKRALTIEQQKECLARLPEEHRDIFEFEMETGIRPGETCALKISDFNFDEHSVKISRTYTKRRLGPDKTRGAGGGWISLTDRALGIAKARARNRFPDEWLFVRPETKQQYDVGALWYIWHRYSGSDLVHYEATRHSLGTQLYEAAGLEAVKAALRHTSTKTSERYSHPQLAFLRSAQAKRTGNVVDLQKIRREKQ